MEWETDDIIHIWMDELGKDPSYRVIKNEHVEIPVQRLQFQRLIMKVQRRHPKLKVLDIVRLAIHDGKKYPPAERRHLWRVTVRNRRGQEIVVTEEGNAFPTKKLDPKLVLLCL